MPTNDYVPFATAGGANVMTPAAWSALAARLTGFVSGTALSVQCNTAWRQSSMAAAMIGQFTADNQPSNVVDNGNVAAYEALFEAALTAWIRSQILPPAAPTIYVRTDGNDANDGLQNNSAHAMATINAALQKAANTWNLAGRTLNIILGTTGVYTGGINNQFVPSCKITGSAAAPQNYQIQAAFPCVNAVGSLDITGVMLYNTGGTQHWCQANIGSAIRLGNVQFSGVASTGSCIATTGGLIDIYGNIQFGINAGSAMSAASSGVISIETGSNIVYAGSPVYSTANVVANSCGSIGVGGSVTPTGAASGVRYIAQMNGAIATFTGNANFWPGTSAGTLLTGGQYN